MNTLETEREKLLKLTYNKKAFEYYQYITDNSLNLGGVDEDNPYGEVNDGNVNVSTIENPLKICYFVFPKLLFDGMMLEALSSSNDPIERQYKDTADILYKVFEDKIFSYNIDIINKNYEHFSYNLFKANSTALNPSTSIQILWLRYLAKCFKFLPVTEREILFEKMMLFCKRFNYVDRNTMVLLMKCTEKYGSLEMYQVLFKTKCEVNYGDYLKLREVVTRKCGGRDGFGGVVNDYLTSQNNRTKTPENKEEKEEKTVKKVRIVLEEKCYCSENKEHFLPLNSLLKNLRNCREKYMIFRCEKCIKEVNFMFKMLVVDNQRKQGQIFSCPVMSPDYLMEQETFNNFDDNTFISNGQGLELNPNKKNIFLNDINSEYRYNSPNTKINRNNIINLKNINNHKRLKSSENNSFHKEGKTYMFNNYMENKNKNMNYIPLVFKRVGTNNFY